jgi:hypothetical protein
MVNYHLKSVMAPQKTFRFKEGVLLVEDMEEPKTKGSLEERPRRLEEETLTDIAPSLSIALILTSIGAVILRGRLKHMKEG